MGQEQSYSRDSEVRDADHFKDLVFATVMSQYISDSDLTEPFPPQATAPEPGQRLRAISATLLENEENSYRFSEKVDAFVRQGMAGKVLTDLLERVQRGQGTKGPKQKKPPAIQEEAAPRPEPLSEEQDLGSQFSYTSTPVVQKHVPKRQSGRKKAAVSRIEQKSKTLQKRVNHERTRAKPRLQEEAGEESPSSLASSSREEAEERSSICLGEPLSITNCNN
jgi:hypothetical protein